MRVLRSAVVATVSIGVILAAGTMRAQSRPDLTGVWADYVDGTQGGIDDPGGLRGPALDLPFTEAGRRKVDAYTKLVAATGDTPSGFCLGPGMPSLILGGATYQMETVQRPEQLTIIYELHNEVRHIYLGSRIIPVADRLPGRNGHSAGRWDVDTLVVDTTNLVEQVDQRFPHSSRAHVVERYQVTRGSRGERVLESDMTMTDPALYTWPISARKKWAEVPNGHLLSYECAEEGWRIRLEQLEKNAQ
jgi:hypothetical protein